MSIYAYVVAGAIAELRELDDGLHAAWVAAGNPKASVYLRVNSSAPPQVQAGQVAESSYSVGDDEVTQVWTVRDKTADELRQTWTAYQFLLRFTPQERAAFRSAAASDPLVADFQQLASAAQEIVSDDPMTVAGMGYLVQAGLLTQQRMTQILTGP
jgi:hypothetical protein